MRILFACDREKDGKEAIEREKERGERERLELPMRREHEDCPSTPQTPTYIAE